MIQINIAYEIVIKLVIAVPLGIWLYRDSRGRDYSWMLWTIIPFITVLSPLILAVIFPFLVLGLYLMIRPKGKMLNCPHCKKSIHEILVICPFCHKEAKRECLSCHEPVPWDAELCPFCKSRALTAKR